MPNPKVDDRTLRLLRARTRLADAIEILERAAIDAGACREDLGVIIERDARSLRWVAQEIGRELEREEPRS